MFDTTANRYLPASLSSGRRGARATKLLTVPPHDRGCRLQPNAGLRRPSVPVLVLLIVLSCPFYGVTS
jgi:hypothetical protein